MSGFSRREFLAAMAAGGAVVAGELWIPSTTLISIPKKIIDVRSAMINRQYGYNERFDYSWVRYLWRGSDGNIRRHLVRMKNRDVTIDEVCQARMIREMERVMYSDLAGIRA